MFELLCAGVKRSLASLLPWDIPWHDPSHTVFFMALYGALGVIGLGMIIAVLRTLVSLKGKGSHH